MSRLRRSLLLGGALLLGGCSGPAAVRVETLSFNEKLRPDRAPLSLDQRAQSPEALPYGRWRTGPDELGALLRPEEPLAGALPQSDCWALANAAGGRDAVLASWEVVGRVTPVDGDGKPLDDWFDPDDGVLDLGLCRLNDPVTRLPPVTRSGDRSAVGPSDCGAISDAGIFNLQFTPGDNFPQCLSDAAIYAVKLDAERASTRDAFGRCGAETGALQGATQRIRAGVDFWREPDVYPLADPDDRRVSACVREAPLIPPTTTRYRLDAGAVYGGTGAAGLTRALTPVVQPYADQARITRPLGTTGSGVSWATRVQQDPSPAKAGVRWEENYASSLRVSTLRVVRAQAAVPAAAQALIPVTEVRPNRPVRLCIEDADSPLAPAGLACRYTCSPASPVGAALQYALDDRYCRDFQGRAVTPALTPTYAVDSAAALLAAGRRDSLRQPLRWHLDEPTLAGAWIEFTLAVHGGTAAMRSGLSVADAGSLRVGESRRVHVAIDNVGAQSLRVLRVELMAGSAHPQDFRVELPFDPKPVPLGVNLDTRSGAVLLGRGEGLSDPARWFRQIDGPASSRASLPRDLSLTIGGVALRRSQQLLWRDVADFPPGWLQALDPQPETAVLAQSWRPRPLPFVMSAREHFLVSVVATPRALGSREARLRILAEPVSGGPPVEIQLPLRVRGLAGPLPAFLPERLVLSASREQAIARHVLLTNDGDVATSLSTPLLTAPGGGSLGPLAARLRLGTPEGATGTLASGASRRARIEFLGSCSGGPTRLLAELRWPTPHGVAILPIEAATVCP